MGFKKGLKSGEIADSEREWAKASFLFMDLKLWIDSYFIWMEKNAPSQWDCLGIIHENIFFKKCRRHG
jgi:hypothetical protein